MKIYTGAFTYTVSQTSRETTWQVNKPEVVFDLLRMRKVAGSYGFCMLKGVSEEDARAWVEEHPIPNPKGWARVKEIFSHYAFSISYHFEKLYDEVDAWFSHLRYRLGFVTWEGEPISLATRFGLTRKRS